MKDEDISYYFDFARGHLQQALLITDQQIADVTAWVSEVDAPEELGFDDINYLIGLGLVACQKYIVRTCQLWEVRKDQALERPPFLPGGVSLVAAINAGANYWKHHEEWTSDAQRPAEIRTKETLIKLGRDPREEYLLTNLLPQVADGNLQSLLPKLVEWAKDLRR